MGCLMYMPRIINIYKTLPFCCLQICVLCVCYLFGKSFFIYIGRMTHENLDIKSVQFKQNIASLPQASVDHQSKKQKG